MNGNVDLFCLFLRQFRSSLRLVIVKLICNFVAAPSEYN